MFLLQSHLFFHDVNNHAIHPYIIEMDLEVILDYQLDLLDEQERKNDTRQLETCRKPSAMTLNVPRPKHPRVQHYYIFVLHSHISIALPCELICILNKQPHGSLLTLNPSFVSDHRHSHFRLFPFYPAGNKMYPCIW